MKLAAICFFGIVALAFITAFKEHMPGPLEAIGYATDEWLQGIIQITKNFVSIED
ncbi:MAG: hypothetical protein R3245_11060 [Kiloniellales bacterium]|nr:hypothetical protein [Kiloniellales bacterium]